MRERAQQARQASRFSGLLLVGILLTGLAASTGLPHRMDLTEDGEFTLSSATLELLDRLEDRLQIKLYFNRDIEGAEGLLPARMVLEDLLDEMKAAGNGLVSVEVVDPTTDMAASRDAEQAGVVAIPLSSSGVGGMSVNMLWQGMELRYQDHTEVLPFVLPGGFEFAVSVRLAAMMRKETPLVGFFSREPAAPPEMPGFQAPPSPDRIFTSLRQIVGGRFDVEDLDLESEEGLPSNLTALVVARPSGLSDREVFEIDQFLCGGGRVVVLHDHESFDLRGSLARTPIETGMDEFLAAHGVAVHSSLVYDSRSQRVPAGRQVVTLPNGAQAVVDLTLPYGFFPALADESLDREHPVTREISDITLMWAHPVSLANIPEALDARVLLRSSDESWTLPEDTSPAIERSNLELLRARASASGQPRSYALAVVLTGAFPTTFESNPEGIPPERERISGSSPGALVVIGDADLFHDATLRPGSGNVDFAANLIDWLAGDEALIRLRTRGESDRRLRNFAEEFIEEAGGWATTDEENLALDRDALAHQRAKERTIAWANVLGPVFFILLAGLFHWRSQKRKASQPYAGGKT